ncbi:hypothetical protein M406DRAFT_347195 [Cryphonectria parasitica EP155]|uniref:Nucleoporin Pom152 n=1 Tax=Cryphonectria parasitica (strain ATCC 38755 / EP155) TaxID=660469 RepID=A0A9P4XZ92_CRYP1|nr:uncharacterized protein M406DRAFT_347195 [Cryphonectria parasitica EP155]KAF3763634.1 hypothetical protein M406DRAFT_347195 [Cryphonectria parasitica EP155]
MSLHIASSLAPRTQYPTNPVIPLHVLDAPTQRFYALGLYTALFAWKLYDWVMVVEDDSESVWLVLKWIFIDFVYIFGLPEFRIPWLEFSQLSCTVAFLFHAVFDLLVMLNIGLPFGPAIVAFLRVFWDREVAISEQYVKVSSVTQNASLILGKQIINILPEGSAVLNPDGYSYCMGGDRTVTLPLHFNATVPVEIEVIRTDLETNNEETLKLTKDHIKTIKKLVKRQESDPEMADARFDWPIKKPGAYRLAKVLDEYKLEVQRLTPNTFVVPCPKARVIASPSSDRCLGDLSDLALEVVGTPPLKINYSRRIKDKDHSFHFQSLQPEGFSSPLMGSHRSSALVMPDDDSSVSWAKAERVTVSLNESMNTGGAWQYSVDEVQDAFGNIVKYQSPADDPEMRPKPKHLVQDFIVKERPTAMIEGCDLRNPVKVAKGKSTKLPVSFHVAGQTDTAHTISWQFSPIDTLTRNGDHGEVVSFDTYKAKNAKDQPKISAPGLYTLKSVSSSACDGHVQEPVSCLLLNPLEPNLVLRSTDIPDKCAGNSIGMAVDFDFVGTPPFTVKYDVMHNGATKRKSFTTNSMRHQEEFIPTEAGTHTYVFKEISDNVYSAQPLTGPEMTLETTVTPAASAYIRKESKMVSACLDKDVVFDVVFAGEAPFTLEWELVHDGKRKQFKAEGIQDRIYKIRTPKFSSGGEYSVSLVSVKDTSGCRIFLQDERKIAVRRQRPRAAFGLLDGKFKTMAIEEEQTKLPVRLSGEGPWTVAYKNLNEGPNAKVRRAVLSSGNDVLSVTQRGTYEIVDVDDAQCPGTVDPKAAQFEVDWLPRPSLAILQAPSIHDESGAYIKNDVCEGDMDGFEVGLVGSPPYHVEYEVRHKPNSGSSAINKKNFDAALSKATVQMDTSRAGTYTYLFSTLSDSLYDDNKKFSPVRLEQKVNPKPTAKFAKPGQTYKSCMADQDVEDTVAIEFSGTAPWTVVFEIKHDSGASTETVRVEGLEKEKSQVKIPREYLRLGGQSVRIRQVSDARGCRRTYETGGPSVQVQLYDAPSIYPLDQRKEYCIGERISYTLVGTPPFEVEYIFDGTTRQAKSTTTNFKRLAETAGEFTITAIRDKASECQAAVNISKTIHPFPTVRISKGRTVRSDIHEGGEVDILFDFTGTPPFEFTYTRSTNERKGQRSQVLETRHDVSYEYSKVVRASQEGTYEVVSIKDMHCAFSTQQVEGRSEGKMLTY